MKRFAPQERIHRGRNVMVNRHPLAILDLDQDIKSGRRPPFQHRFLRAAASGLLVAQCHALDPTHQVGQRWIDQQVLQGFAVRGAHQLHAPLCDRACRNRLLLPPDLVDDNDLRHVVFHRLDHYLMLKLRPCHLHPPRPTDGRVRDVAVAADFVGSVHHDNARLLAEDTRRLAQQRGLAYTRSPQQQNALIGFDDIFDYVNYAIDRAADATGQTDDAILTIADARDAVKRTLDPAAIIAGEQTDALDDAVQVLIRDFTGAQHQLVIDEARLGPSAQVHHDFEQTVALVCLPQRLLNGGR